MNEMFVSRITQADCKGGFLLDGYPRTLPQAFFLDEKLKELGFPKPTIFHLATPQSVLIERISSRRQCPKCGRIYNLLFKPPFKKGVCDLDGTDSCVAQTIMWKWFGRGWKRTREVTTPITWIIMRAGTIIRFRPIDRHSRSSVTSKQCLFRDCIKTGLRARLK